MTATLALAAPRDDTEGAAAAKEHTAPHPDHPSKPDSPPDLPARSWRYTAKVAASEFKRDHCLDLAAALTFYAVGALFPALIVVIALIGVFGSGESTAETIIALLSDVAQEDVIEQLREPITRLASSTTAGLALLVGIGAALWSASGYVGAFGRAMNRIYEVDEGRPFWKLRPLNLLITLGVLVGAAALVVGMTVSGAFAQNLGEQIGLGQTAVDVWTIARWPAMLGILALLVSLLYYATPNIQQPKFRWLSVGAAMAMVLWLGGSIGFAFYVDSFGSYDQTYGSLAGVIIVLMWLWLTNIALLFGAEFDAELERARQLEAGIEAEETLQLPPRDTQVSEKNAAKLAEQVAEGRALRLRATAEQEREGAREAPTAGRDVVPVAVGALTLVAAAIGLRRRSEP